MPSPIEISISANREDLQKTLYFLARRSHSWAHIKALLWTGAAMLSFFAEQWIPAGICVFVAMTHWLRPWWQVRQVLRKMPEWAYGPMTFSLDGGGAFIMAPEAARQFGWDAITSVTLTDDDWIFNAAGQDPIVLPRRALSKEDDAAIREMVEHHGR